MTQEVPDLLRRLPHAVLTIAVFPFLGLKAVLDLRAVCAALRALVETDEPRGRWERLGPAGLQVPTFWFPRALSPFEMFQTRMRLSRGAAKSVQGIHLRLVARVRPPSAGSAAGRLLVPHAGMVSMLSASPLCLPVSACLDADCGNRRAFEQIMGPLLLEVMTGANTTVFLYGQTGSGKTWTSLGPSAHELTGIIPQTISHLREQRCTLRVRACEIYGEKVFTLGETGAPSEAFLRSAVSRRRERATEHNERSSRSHLIVGIRVTTPSRKTCTLNLVDLCGSERQSSTGDYSPGLVRESSKINQSLSTLSRVVQALAERDAHVPYRDSSLTSMLKGSLGGSSLTTFVLCLSPDAADEPETVSTMRFGQRAARVELTPLGTHPALLDLCEVQQRLAQVQAVLGMIQARWMECGLGHDLICRCDACQRRHLPNQPGTAPLHIPHYVSLLREQRDLQDQIRAARLQVFGEMQL